MTEIATKLAKVKNDIQVFRNLSKKAAPNSNIVVNILANMVEIMELIGKKEEDQISAPIAFSANCPSCKENDFYIDNLNILASNPPRRKRFCNKCGFVDFIAG